MHMATESVEMPLTAFGLWPAEVRLIKQTEDGKAIWEVAGTRGRFALKRVNSRRRAKKIGALSHYLHRNGLPVPPAVVALNGRTSLETEEGYYLLFPWVEGERPAYAAPGRIGRIAELLGRFHEGSRGYVAGGGCVTDWRLDWNEVYRRLAAQLDRAAGAAAARPDPFGALLLEHLPWLRARIDWVLHRLPASPLAALAAEARQDPLLCHGDYSRDNVLEDRAGALTIIDLDTVCVCLPVWDISRLITWINHDQQDWSAGRLQAVLDAYAAARPLSVAEQDLLLLDQTFPHLAIAIARGYYEADRPSLLEELGRCLRTDRAKLADLGTGPL
jgi:spore coat-associated protein S